MSDRGTGAGEAPRVWLDGEEIIVPRGKVQVDELAVVEGARGWARRPFERSEISWARAEAGEQAGAQPQRVQLFLPELERGFLAFVRGYRCGEELCVATCDLLELDPMKPGPSPSSGRPVELIELDGVALGAIEATLSIEAVEDERDVQRVGLSLRVPAEELPGAELMRLTQPRAGRRLRVAGVSGEGVLLRDPSCRRARVRGRPDAWASGELELELELECLVERPARASLAAASFALAEVGDAGAWLRGQCERIGAGLEPVERELVEALDAGEAERLTQQWLIYTDWLLARGSGWGRALTGDLSGLGPTHGRVQLDALAALDELEGGRWERPGRQWCPWIQLQWHGPFVTRMWVRPMWRAPSFERPRLRWPPKGPGEGAPSEPAEGSPRPRWEELLGVGLERAQGSAEPGWTMPGLDPRPELAELLALPCCRLLSPTRVELLLPAPSWEGLLAAER